MSQAIAHPATHLTEGALDPRAPFDFAQTLRFVGAFSPAAGEQTTNGETLRKAVMIRRRPVVFTVRSSGSIEQPRLDYILAADAPISAEVERAALDRIRFYFSLDDDLQPFYATVGASDPAFEPVMRRLYGFHQVKFLTPFENACWAVLTQRMPMPVARALKRALVARFGASLAVEGQEYWAFPEAEALAATGRDALAELLRNERKATYLHAVAEAFASVDEAWLRAGDYEQVREWLLAIDGIGAWSASFVLIRGLGRMDAIATPEKELLNAARSVYGSDTTPEALSRLAREVYGASAGYWSYYLRNARQ
jgi:DNA-3-methyladenine glycosylase II